MWSQFLDQSRSERKFENVPVIILGNKHSGKRSLVDCLFDISQTILHNKRMSVNVDVNKMKLRGLAPVIDYAYLNVIDFNDPDYRTHSKLQIYMIQDKYDFDVFSQLEKCEILKKAVVVIMLDFTKPWSFMEQLDGWINFVKELQKRAGFSIVELEEMADNVSRYYKTYKEPQFDENGKIKKHFGDESTEDVLLDIAVPDGVLVNNIRMPLVVCVNKCDLQFSVLRQDSYNKMQTILYHLRKFCIQYGGSLIYTSIKNKTNLNILYEYILHRAYKMQLRYKKQSMNEETIFIPFGADSPNVIQDSIMRLDVSKSYAEAIQKPFQKTAKRNQVLVEDDSEFFKRYINTDTSSQPTDNTTIKSYQNDETSSVSTGQNSKVPKIFFEQLKKRNIQLSKAGAGTKKTETSQQ